MEIYSTEEQQVEAIKSWWRDNGVAVLLGAVVGLGGLYGWRYYQSEKLASQEQASAGYSMALNAMASDSDNATLAAEAFIANNDDSYASLLSLQLAKNFVDNNQLAKAAEQLRLVQQSDDNALAALATLRLARVQLELGELEAALNELTHSSAQGFVAQVEELKGDIYARQANMAAAKQAYSLSLAEQINPVVQMKLDNIANDAK